MTISMGFGAPPATCALCGRAVSADDAILLEKLGPAAVESEQHGASIDVTITPGERLVVCRDCAPPDRWPEALAGDS